MTEMENFDDMFELNADSFVEQASESELYKPNHKKGKNGVYNSLVRFVAWHKAPKESIVDLWTGWLENPLTKKGMSVVCPSSIKGQQSDLQDVYWKLKNSPVQSEKDKAKYFSRKRAFYAIVQVLKDENNPQLEGKLKVFKFGIKIYEKIQAELKPAFGVPHIPFHPFDGRPFYIKCKEVAGYANIDDSKFLDQPAPIMISGQPVQRGQEAELKRFLEENSPNLDNYRYKAWTDAQRKHFDDMVAVILPSAQTKVASLLTESVGTAGTQATKTEQVIEKAPEVNDEPAAPLNFNFNLD